jgi:lipoprotein-releasing system ATP-binding protein
MTILQPVISLRKICKTYLDGVATPVLFDVDLDVFPGEFVAVVGASGSGKTTLLNLIGLLDTPSSGDVILDGNDVGQLTDDLRTALRRDYIGFIFQFHYLLPQFTVLENVLMPSRLKGKDAEQSQTERMTGLLDLVGLKERIHYRASKLSGGEQQRAAIVRALANDPRIVLADEPTGNLDSKSGHMVFELMQHLNKVSRKAFLMVTHDETFAREADRVIHIVDGKIR